MHWKWRVGLYTYNVLANRALDTLPQQAKPFL